MIPRTGGKYCPKCLHELVVIGLLTTVNLPNECRTSTYICKFCTKKGDHIVLVFYKKIILNNFKHRGKFPSARRMMKKLTKMFNRYSTIIPVIEYLHQKKYCIHCKKELYPDRHASNSKLKNGLQIRTFYHLSCTNRNNHEPIFFFVRGITENLEILTIIEG